jgi:hypothetical protein
MTSRVRPFASVALLHQPVALHPNLPNRILAIFQAVIAWTWCWFYDRRLAFSFCLHRLSSIMEVSAYVPLSVAVDTEYRFENRVSTINLAFERCDRYSIV